jgi:hypothetical protein
LSPKGLLLPGVVSSDATIARKFATGAASRPLRSRYVRRTRP